jgi:SlyX protein
MRTADANPGTIEQRLTDLEVRLSFIDDAVQSLDATVAAQDRTLAETVRALERLRDELAGMQAAGQDARDEPPPPHY